MNIKKARKQTKPKEHTDTYTHLSLVKWAPAKIATLTAVDIRVVRGKKGQKASRSVVFHFRAARMERKMTFPRAFFLPIYPHPKLVPSPTSFPLFISFVQPNENNSQHRSIMTQFRFFPEKPFQSRSIDSGKPLMSLLCFACIVYYGFGRECCPTSSWKSNAPGCVSQSSTGSSKGRSVRC